MFLVLVTKFSDFGSNRLHVYVFVVAANEILSMKHMYAAIILPITSGVNDYFF